MITEGATSVLTIRNNKTGKTYTVDNIQWESMKSKKHGHEIFTVTEEKRLMDAPQTTYMPNELQKAIGDLVENNNARKGTKD